MLKELLKLPEWKKFSASLPPGPAAPLTFVLRADDARTLAVLKGLTSEWKATRHLAALTRKRVRDIAFEVYLDQVVADCQRSEERRVGIECVSSLSSRGSTYTKNKINPKHTTKTIQI